MDPTNPFKWRHYEATIILLCVRWYLRYSLSYRDLEEMMVERGLRIDHSTICRWVHRYAPQLEQRVRAHLRPPNDSWRVDETYIKVRGEWMYLYRALDSAGNTVEFVFSPYRHAQAAEYFFRKALGGAHTMMPRVINVDGNAAYPPALAALQADGTLAATCEVRPVKYLNNIIEQDHRFIKRRVRTGLGFWSCQTAWRTLQGYEAIHQLRKGQVRGTTKGDIVSQNRFIRAVFGVAA
jgi:transposase-like protein